VALAFGLLALSASVFHLGRPLYAFRAFLGLRTSWMSREIVAFGAFAGAAMLYAAITWRQPICELLGLPPMAAGLGRALEVNLGSIVALSGIVGVFCSVMIYHVTLRRFWAGWNTAVKFFGTTVLLGASMTLVTTTLCALATSHASALTRGTEVLLRLVLFATLAKLAHEASLLLRLGDKQQNELKRSAMLLLGDLRDLSKLRLGCGLLGGVVLPIIGMAMLSDGLGVGLAVISVLSLASLAAGELLERLLFFAAVSAPRMPGTFG
jgi:formate dehydrogenase iron-sulfur subunit